MASVVAVPKILITYGLHKDEAFAIQVGIALQETLKRDPPIVVYRFKNGYSKNKGANDIASVKGDGETTVIERRTSDTGETSKIRQEIDGLCVKNYAAWIDLHSGDFKIAKRAIIDTANNENAPRTFVLALSKVAFAILNKISKVMDNKAMSQLDCPKIELFKFKGEFGPLEGALPRNININSEERSDRLPNFGNYIGVEFYPQLISKKDAVKSILHICDVVSPPLK
jgi:hypothetical protein